MPSKRISVAFTRDKRAATVFVGDHARAIVAGEDIAAVVAEMNLVEPVTPEELAELKAGFDEKWTPKFIAAQPPPARPPQPSAEATDRANKNAKREAYQAESDPLFFEWQAAVASGQSPAIANPLKAAWLAKRAEIEAATGG